jgi:hypothetical protein
MVFCSQTVSLSVASWAPFSQLSYGTRQCAVVNVTELRCTTGTSTTAGNIFSVVFDDGAGVYLAAAEPYQFFSSLNATAVQRLAYPVNATAFRPCYAPTAPLLRSASVVVCANASLIAYPSAAVAFLNSSAGAYSASLWLGLWVAFLCVFAICVPILVIMACTIWRATD